MSTKYSENFTKDKIKFTCKTIDAEMWLRTTTRLQTFKFKKNTRKK